MVPCLLTGAIALLDCYASSFCNRIYMMCCFLTVSVAASCHLSLFHHRFLIIATMKFSAELKQHILTQYRAHSRSDSYRALSRRYGLSSNGLTIKRWMRRWDGTVSSLHDHPRPGRPHILTRQQVHN